MGVYDGALVELQAAVKEMRDRDTTRMRSWYRSKELFEHATGMIHEMRGNVDSAKAAYGRALQEHLSYYPAHMRLGTLALLSGDTATAVSELDLAVQVAPDEPL